MPKSDRKPSPRALCRRVGLILLTLCCVVGLSGCGAMGMDVENRLRPPHATGDQEEIQNALESSIRDQGLPSQYVLKYPKNGEYRSAFVLKDLDSDGEEEALAFYRPGGDTSTVHINLMRQTDGQWASVSDIAGMSTDIDSVDFGDLDGDGNLEIFTGWDIYNTRDRQLVMYSLRTGEFVEMFSDIYGQMVVGDIRSSGHDDLLLLRIQSSSNTVTARLLVMDSGAVIESDQVKIDGYIQQFGNTHVCPLSEEISGVFIDGIRVGGGMVTELVYWDGTRLIAPLYSEETNTVTDTYRSASIPSLDIDGDGMIEWPQCYELAGVDYETDADPLWRTVWMSWDLSTGQSSPKSSSIVNMKDSYSLSLPSSWVDMVTADYTAEDHLFRLYTVEDGEKGSEILAIRASSSISPGESNFDLLTTAGNIYYEVRIAQDEPYDLNVQRVQYMFTVLSD